MTDESAADGTSASEEFSRIAEEFRHKQIREEFERRRRDIAHAVACAFNAGQHHAVDDA
ncbi:MAG TPA: hypothetical protein VFB45_14920 [Pseudolabrys sp.]|nr:hypothetical protein [Pseudolabrys sp.]